MHHREYENRVRGTLILALQVFDNPQLFWKIISNRFKSIMDFYLKLCIEAIHNRYHFKISTIALQGAIDRVSIIILLHLCLCFSMTPNTDYWFFAGECIKCYECNSQNDPRCADPFDSYTIGEVDCDLKPKLDHLSSYNATICRKISQKGDLNTGVRRGKNVDNTHLRVHIIDTETELKSYLNKKKKSSSAQQAM